MFILKKIHQLSLAKRLATLIVSAISGIIILTFAFLYTENTLIRNERQDSVKHTVEMAYTLVEHYQQLATQAKMSEPEAKQAAMAAIKSLRYGKGDYVWLNDMHPTMVMHPIKPELDGKDLTEIKDPAGKYLFVDMVNAVKAHGEDFVYYSWPRPGSDKPVPKVSYVKLFSPWGWIIGSGVYIDGVESSIIERSIQVAIGTITLALLLFVLGYLISHGLRNQLGCEPQYAMELTKAIAAGDLTVHIELDQSNQESLLYSIFTMRNSLRDIIREVRKGTESILISSQEIATGNMDLSSRTESQASSLEETSASMLTLMDTVHQNSSNARNANQLAASASEVALKGGTVVNEVVSTMSEINTSSQKIVDIISVIDGIAFQTNILALNAAVEAARAGEQGRGFAVVASEVRSLAQRSASAAKEIKLLINDSVENVKRGTQLVDQAGGTMQEIVASVKDVSNIMTGITQSTDEQASGIEQVNEAIKSMDEVTQQNAALVEEAAAAAAAMQDQATTLSEVVRMFKMRGDTQKAVVSQHQHQQNHHLRLK
jgi:methyl-accepting chemotaxis protein